MNLRILLGLALLLVLTTGQAATADDAARLREIKALTDRLKYQQGEISLRSGLATLKLTKDFRYLDAAGTETVLNGIWGNPPSPEKPLGMIVPADFDPFSQQAWCVVIRYQDDGYVKDDDAEKINYTKLLKEMKEGVKEASA